MVLDMASWPCPGTGGRSLYRGNSGQKAAIFYEMLFLLWHFILQLGCSWGLCVPVAAAAWFRPACYLFASVCKRNSEF